MKILKGSLVETRYAWPTVNRNNNEERPLKVISEKTYGENQVTYMSDKLGLHRIKNPNPDDYAVSLHCKLSDTALCALRSTDQDSVYTPKCGGLWVQHLRRADRKGPALESLRRFF